MLPDIHGLCNYGTKYDAKRANIGRLFAHPNIMFLKEEVFAIAKKYGETSNSREATFSVSYIEDDVKCTARLK